MKRFIQSRQMLFVLPVILLLITRVGIEFSVRVLELRFAWIPAFFVYYATIELCLFYGKRGLGVALPPVSIALRPIPKWNRLVFGVVLPALLPFGVFLFNVKAVPFLFLAFTILFALFNPYFEESFWRGLLSFLPGNTALKIFYSALLFSFSHYFLWGAYWLDNPPSKWMATVIATFVMGLLWMWFFQKERRLLYPILSHVFVDIFNLSVAVFYGIKLVTV